MNMCIPLFRGKACSATLILWKVKSENCRILLHMPLLCILSREIGLGRYEFLDEGVIGSKTQPLNTPKVALRNELSTPLVTDTVQPVSFLMLYSYTMMR